MMKLRHLSVFLFLPWLIARAAGADTEAELKNLSGNGGIADGKARLVIEALLGGTPGEKEKLIFATTLLDSVKVASDKLTHNFTVTIDILQGEPKELPLTINGEGEIRQVTGETLQDWSIRREN